MKRRYLIVAIILQASALFASPAKALIGLTDPVVLNPGDTVNSLPNGYSSSVNDPGVTLFDDFISFDFTNGPVGTLRERVLQYSTTDSAHPFGGLYFDYEITLTSGDVIGLTVPGYAGLDVAVKQCGIPGCGGSGANGVSVASASRTSDGNLITFGFGNDDLIGGTHSANMQLLTNAVSFVDPLGTLESASGDFFSVALIAPNAVPELSTWAMMLLGFAGLGFAGYHRSRKARSNLA